MEIDPKANKYCCPAMRYMHCDVDRTDIEKSGVVMEFYRYFITPFPGDDEELVMFFCPFCGEKLPETPMEYWESTDESLYEKLPSKFKGNPE